MTSAADWTTDTRLVSLRAVSPELGVPYTTLRDCALRGEFSIWQINGTMRTTRAELHAWIERSKERPVPPGRKPPP